jgi:PAS domain S-box-containing protein/putative nucleotidyltransferase with HDIG domain
MHAPMRAVEDAPRRDWGELLTAIFDAVDAWVVVLDMHGIVRDVNPACLSATGYARTELVGRPIWETVVPADDARRVRRVFSKLVEGKGPNRLVNDWVARDGSRRTVAWSNAVTTGKDGKVDRVIGTGIDLTESLRTRQELASKRHYAEALIENALDVISVIDAEGVIRFQSPSVERVLGYKPEDLIGKNAFDYIHAEDVPAVGEAMAAALAAQGNIESQTFRFRAADGTWHWLEAVGRNLIDDPAIHGIIVSSRDITAPRELEQRYRTIFELSPDAIVVVDPETTLMLAFNRAACELHGFEPEEMRGLRIADYDIGESEAEIRERAKRVFATGRDDFETRIRRPDGEVRDVQVRLSLIDISGRPALNAIVHDITESKRAHAALTRSELRFRHLVETTPDWVWQTDADNVCTYASPQVTELLGYAPEEVTGRTSFDFMTPAEAERVRTALAGAFERHEPIDRFENVLVHKDGRAVVMEVSAVPVFSPQGAFGGYRGINRDVTERKSTERELRRINRVLRLTRRCNAELVEAREEQALLGSICRLMVEDGGYRFAFVGFMSEESKSVLRIVAFHGEGAGYVREIKPFQSGSELGDDAPEWISAVRKGEPAVVRDIAALNSTKTWCKAALDSGFASRASLPLRAGNEIFGVLTVFSAEVDVFDEEEVGLLDDLAADLAYGVTSLRESRRRREAESRERALEQDRQQAMIQTIEAIALAAEARDPYTSGHEKRVAKLSEAVAREMGLDDHRCEGIRIAATIHDIGKLNVPMDILARPSRLSDAEYELVKAHARIGYNVLKSVDFPWPVAEMVLQHHERWDGSGYPQGLKGEDILLEARIIGVADVVEAMSGHRPYRPARGLDSALLHLLENRGVLYDPSVVDACLKICRQHDPFAGMTAAATETS